MEESAGNIILGKTGRSERFMLKWGWFRFWFSIRPVTVRGIIEISQQLSHLSDVSVDSYGMFEEIVKHSGNLKYICKAIAISTGTRFRALVTRGLMDLSIEDIFLLWSVLIKQTDPKSFFFIMVSAKGMNQLKTRKEPEQSGEGIQSSGASQ